MKALVLSGGSIKGAFQAGALKAVFESGFEPDIITGISVGTLNGVFLASEIGRQKREGKTVNWPLAGERLYDFWIKNIRTEKDIVKKRKLKPIIQAITGKFNGIHSSDPIDKLVTETINLKDAKNSGIQQYFGAVNLYSGKIEYASSDHHEFEKMILASKAIPIVMPYVWIEDKLGNKEPWYDGGVRDSAGLKMAMTSGATEIQCVLCHPVHMKDHSFKQSKVVELTNRLLDFHTNETLTNDIEGAKLINELIRISNETGEKSNLTQNKHHVKFHDDIRPEKTVSLDLKKFDSSDIRRVMEEGYAEAKKTLNLSAIA